MKAIQVRQAGGPEVLELVNLPTPTPQKGWSLIKIKGFGINRSEIFTRQGYSPSVTFPRILGIECVGIIETSEVFPIGQKVVSIMGEMGRAFDGGYAEYVTLPDHQIYPIDSQLDWSDLAAVPETYYTAYGSLLNLQIKPTDRVLVRAATSGVGLAFARLLKAQFPEIKLTGSTRQFDKAEALYQAGYDKVITEKNGQLLTHENYDKILELVGPATLKDSLGHAAEQGIICQTGQLGGQWYLDNFDPIEQLQNNVYLTTFYSGKVNLEKMQALFNYINRYQVAVSPEKIFRLEEVPQAHAYLESRQSFGKVVVIND